MLGARGDAGPQHQQASKLGMQRKIESYIDSSEEELHAPAAPCGGYSRRRLNAAGKTGRPAGLGPAKAT